MRLITKIFLLSLSVCLSACATMSSGARRQYVLVRSSPPGAPIVINGETVGFTPDFVEVRRGHKMSVELETAAGPQPVKLNTHYRWFDSFWSGFIFLYMAPVSWLVDLATGAAWEADFSDVTSVRLTRADQRRQMQIEREPLAAIAPPLASDMAISDQGGRALEKRLLAQDLRLRPYENTLPIFTANDYDFDGRPSTRERGQLYHLLNADLVYESYIEPTDQGLVLHAEAINVMTDARSNPQEIILQPASTVDRIYSIHSWWSRLVPNTIGLTWAENYLTFQQGKNTYKSAPARNQPWWAYGLDYLNAIDISNSPQRRYGRSGRTLWGFVPSFRISRQYVEISNLPPTIEGQEDTYTRWWVSGGYGPELGYQSSRHYFYVNFIPVLYWSELWWTYKGEAHTLTESKLGSQEELGYVFFFNSNWQARLFVRTSADAESIWTTALQSRLATSDPLSVRAITSGLILGYRISPSLNKAY